MTITKTITIPIPGSRESVIVQTKNKNPTVPYRCMGSGMENQCGKSLNLPRVLVSLNKEQQRLLCDLIDGYDFETGLSVLVPWDHAPSLSEAYQGLKKQKLVVRVKKGQYMLNPNLVVNPKHYLRLVLVWGDLVKSE